MFSIILVQKVKMFWLGGTEPSRVAAADLHSQQSPSISQKSSGIRWHQLLVQDRAILDVGDKMVGEGKKQ